MANVKTCINSYKQNLTLYLGLEYIQTNIIIITKDYENETHHECDVSM